MAKEAKKKEKKGGGWIFQENQWIWIEDDPPTDDNDWIL